MTATEAAGTRHIVVCVPTYRRNNMLADCLAALGRITRPAACRISVIVADNDSGGGAGRVTDRIRSRFPYPLHYVIEPQRGLAAVRNRLLEEAARTGADWIAFLDDDEMPEQEWLAVLVEAADRHEADVVTGPLIPIETPADVHVPRDRSSRPTGVTPRYVATNNVMFRAGLTTEQGLRFDRYYDFIGGEDFDFFNRSRRLGNTHIWVSEALVFETVPAARKSLRYLFYRHLSGGVNNVLRYKKDHGSWRAWCHFLPRLIGKLLGGLIALLRAALTFDAGIFRKSVKQLAAGGGFGAGLCGITVERYRHIDGD